MKVLIYMDKNRLEPIGGPSGYLFNLYNQLLKEENNSIKFLDSQEEVKHMKKKKILKSLPKFLQNIYYNYKKKNYGKKILKVLSRERKKVANIDLNIYDIIHFHEPLVMYNVKDSLENYKGIVVLTSHSPKVGYQEIINRIPKDEYNSDKEKYNKIEEIDKYAFERADYIVFPCEEAEEPYFNTWKYYEKVKENKKDKYKYIPTGIEKVKIKYTREEIRKRYNIPENAFVVSYIGRHNEIKGYDFLKKVGEELIKKYENIYFLIAGKEEPLKGINNPRWIEAGWTKDAKDIVNAADLFILPNKETYFDLVLLEVMSLGKVIVLSNTGGNKYFKKFNSNGLLYFDKEDKEKAIEQIEKVMNNRELIDKNDNRSIFENNFTIGKFSNNYKKMMEEIYKENNESEK